ncbi:ROK family protein [Chitinophaga cymbidii]|uniref:Glucokinase n=1 Tax=Chitinophaga cymbidii TaxID=1096750 RepID=A0A512RK99_9BACT|nr:ROK family protein [Chitinophaga cymbidii]GEP96143.1 glucokinase [Chitinophaga cymbidii]
MILAIDLGGTKIASAVFSRDGKVLQQQNRSLDGRGGKAVGRLVTEAVAEALASGGITAIGIAVPGISRHQTGTIWAPNIAGWDDYPLLEEVRAVAQDIPVYIESDRSCYILGEAWQGNAQGCNDAIYLAVGTGIGAGILTGGRLLHGAADIGGAIGWMALDRPFQASYTDCGCFESMASGEGIAKVAAAAVAEDEHYSGVLKKEGLRAQDVFSAYGHNDRIAIDVITQCISLWGMAAANLISLFNPVRIIFGGGVFGPAVALIPLIAKEAARWAQPVSMGLVKLEASALGNSAGLYGAACLAMKSSHYVQ